ncbi:response regulator [bacterium]|nr:response regulator [bacterium]
MKSRVLIVDDSLTVRMDLGDAFAAAGFETTLCETVAAARTALSRQTFEVIVLDVLLPDADGLAFLKEIKLAAAMASVPVMLLSSEADVRDRVRGLKTGADEYVGKPYETGYVVARARELIGTEPSAARRSAATVLVIDDSSTFRELLRDAFEAAGYAVLLAETGEDGLRLAVSAAPDAVVVDGMLPGIDGATVIRRLRSDAALQRTPCLLLTASTSDERTDELQALEAGADAYVRKAQDTAVILARLTALLRPGRASAVFASTSSLLGPKRLLAVDDSLTYLHELAGQLRDEGYDVALARSGEEALDLLAVQPVDAILLDLVMPGLSGQETCRRIKSSPAWRETPVLILTAHDDRGAMLEGINAGADDYIGKSSDFEVLKARLRAQMRRRQFEDENRRIREALLRREQDALEARAARELAEVRAAQMRILARIGETARTPGSIETLLPELLRNALDAAGISVGAVFLVEPDGQLGLRAQHGFAQPRRELEAFFGRIDLLRRAMERHEPVHVPARQDEDVAERELLERAGAPALLLVPLHLGEQGLGALVLAAARKRPAGEWLPFAEAVGTQIAQAVALAQAMARIALEHERFKKTEEQLRHAQKMEAVGRLAGGVAHDFNNLLTAINGYSELILARLSERDPLRNDLEEIRKAGQRATALTRQLLAFSRKQLLQPRVLDLDSVVESMDGMLRRLIGEDVDLVSSRHGDLGRVRADPGQIEQVIVNLAVNARDAMPPGGKLTIETRNVDLDEAYAGQRPDVAPGPYVLLAVTDTGTGMDKQTLSHLFEPFFTTKGQGKGTGLGLSTTYGIVKQSGGHIAVYSEPGHGTTFKVYLPRVEDAPEPTPSSARYALSPRGSETILLVEDEDMVRSFVRMVLSMNGYTVLEATNGSEAILVCERHAERIHLLVTDVVLPQLSGRQVWERLSPLRPDMRVLYMSGYTDDAIVHHGVLDPGTSFIQKPFTPSALAREVRAVLDAPGGGG